MTVHPFPIERIGDFPLDDHDRTRGAYAEPADHRHILDADVIEPQDDAADQFVTMPVRSVVVDGIGPRIEIGRYSLTPAEADHLARTLHRMTATLAGGVA